MSNDYYNVQLNGVGYVNGIKSKTSDNGPFVVLTISALQGHKDTVTYTRIDCIAVTEKAKDVLKEIDNNNPDAKVLCRFELSGLETSPFDYPDTSQRAGESGVNVRSKLMALTVLRINGEKPGSTPDKEAPQAHKKLSAGIDADEDIEF